jgi:5-formyltetrahydrofolate cyclo-ligase
MYSKIIVRQEMLNKRLNLKNEEIIYCSDIISDFIRVFIKQRAVKSAAFYMSIKNEVKIELAIDRILYENIKINLPYCKKNSDICFYKFKDTRTLVKDNYGILSPKCDKETDISSIDVFFIPGLAFDRAGNRIGYGKGCYDKVLTGSKKNSIFVGVCYNFQIYDKKEIEFTQNDIKMHYLICEKGIINCSDNV